MQQPTSTCLLLDPGTGDHSAADLVRASAARLGIHVRSGSAEVEAGKSLTESLVRAIKDADLVVAVVSRHMPANAWYTLGLAGAASRSLLLVLDGVEQRELSSVSDFRTVGPVLSTGAVERAVRRALKAPPKSPGIVSATGAPLSANLWQKLNSELNSLSSPTLDGGISAARFEQWFAELLTGADVPFTNSAHNSTLYETRSFDNVDFAVSAAELSPNLGDPLPVELILGSAQNKLRTRSDSFDRYLATAGSATLLIVTLADYPPGMRSLTNGEALWVSASLLLGELRHKPFGQAVLALRSRTIEQIARSGEP